MTTIPGKGLNDGLVLVLAQELGLVALTGLGDENRCKRVQVVERTVQQAGKDIMNLSVLCLCQAFLEVEDIDLFNSCPDLQSRGQRLTAPCHQIIV